MQRTHLLPLAALLVALVGGTLAGIRINPCGGQPDGAVFPNQEADIIIDCGTYVTCKAGADMIKTCPKGLQLNPHTLQCQVPAAAMCKRGAKSPMPIMCRSRACAMKPQAVKYLVGAGRRLSGLRLNPCAGQRDGAVFPNQEADIIIDCSTYVTCKNGADVFKPCPACPKGDPRCAGAKTMVFNPHSLKCDWPKGGGCKVGMCTTKPLLCK